MICSATHLPLILYFFFEEEFGMCSDAPEHPIIDVRKVSGLLGIERPRLKSNRAKQSNLKVSVFVLYIFLCLLHAKYIFLWWGGKNCPAAIIWQSWFMPSVTLLACLLLFSWWHQALFGLYSNIFQRSTHKNGYALSEFTIVTRTLIFFFFKKKHY